MDKEKKNNRLIIERVHDNVYIASNMVSIKVNMSDSSLPGVLADFIHATWHCDIQPGDCFERTPFGEHENIKPCSKGFSKTIDNLLERCEESAKYTNLKHDGYGRDTMKIFYVNGGSYAFVDSKLLDPLAALTSDEWEIKHGKNVLAFNAFEGVQYVVCTIGEAANDETLSLIHI